jgi:DNA-binding beta-propeller fold protein YncE
MKRRAGGEAAIVVLMLGFALVAAHASFAQERWPDWRAGRLPRVEVAPDPARISMVPLDEGWTWVLGGPGAAVDPRARMVRIFNLATGDQAAAPVRGDGSFGLRLFAPSGSALQINTNMLQIDELPWELQAAVRERGKAALENLAPESPGVEMIGGHLSSSPAIILSALDARSPGGRWPGVVRKVGRHVWLVARAEPSSRQVSPGQSLDLDVTLTVVFGPEAETRDVPRGPLALWPHLHPLFDRDGRQRPYGRLPLSAVLTPTGLPIETHGEVVAEPGPDGRKVWNLGGIGLSLPWHLDEPASWKIEGNHATLAQRVRMEITTNTPPGIYGLAAAFPEIGQEEFGALEAANCPAHLCQLRIGEPAPPRLTCLLLGSAGTGGTRGAIAREDRGQFAINMKIAYTPDKLVIPRDDAYTGEPWTYPLDPYVPMVSTAVRPFGPAIPNPLIPFDFRTSRLTVTIDAPSGARHTLGPARLACGQNDLSVLRPDHVLPDRVVPPVRPTYGNPSMTDMYHLTGRGTFDHAFREYGHHVVRLEGHVDDAMGTTYAISGTYDVYVARPLDLDVFPEPGTPLEADVPLSPQVRVMPPMPAEVEIRFRHYPYSEKSRAIERKIMGRTNGWGVFVPGANGPPIAFSDPGEYVCDVTVRHEDAEGTLWMACRRGASVVMTPDSPVVVHGERGNRSPTARWRARWFVAGDGRFIAPPPPEKTPPELPPGLPPDALADEKLNRVDLGHTCFPYESGDVAWLGHTMTFSLFPGLTFEDPEGTIAGLIERRWPAVRDGAGREGLYPYGLKPEDRRAIGEMPYASMTASGLPPSVRPDDVDQWGYFYVTSWRPGVSVRTLVAEDAQPVGYWFFDDPYAWQFGNGPQGDLPGDVKMNYGGGVFRDASSGVAHYGGYASMLVLIDGRDPRGARVLPPFDGLVPGSPPCGPLLEIGGKRYDVFLTFGALAPGAVLEVGQRLRVAGVVWPPVSGHVEGEIIAPSGERAGYKTRAGPMGVFDYAGPVADEPGVWTVSAEGVCSGKTSVGTLSALVPEGDWPRGGGVGLSDPAFPVPVVPKGSPPIAFDLPPGTRANPPSPLVIRGHLPPAIPAEGASVLVSLPGQVVDHRVLPVTDGAFEYVYDPTELRTRFPNIDTRVEVPPGGFEHAPAWFDTVTLTFWAGEGAGIAAGMVLLQAEDVFAHTSTSAPRRAMPHSLPQNPRTRDATHGSSEAMLPTSPAGGSLRSTPATPRRAATPARGSANGPPVSGVHSSLLALAPGGRTLFAVHPWSGEVVRLDVGGTSPRVARATRTGGEPRSVALWPEGGRLCASLADRRQIVVLDARSLDELARFDVPGEPRAVLPSSDGRGLLVADFEGDRILRLGAATGAVEAQSDCVNRPACLALHPETGEIYTVSFRTGRIAVLDEKCDVLRRLEAPGQLNQCRCVTLGPDGGLYAPQTRSDTAVGGRTFDRSVFPAVAVADPGARGVRIEHFPDLLVVPPHRPVEVAVDRRAVYLASSGSDDVLAIDRRTGFAKWHAAGVGLEPGGIALDAARDRLYVLTITGQEIVTLDAGTGGVLARTRFARDPTPPEVARGRYLFGTATDKRLTKDQWMSCAVCHPGGAEDGRQWDLGRGPLDTRSLRGCLQTTPLHPDAHLDEIQDTYDFTRTVMAGQWFVPRQAMHDLLGKSNAGRDPDLDALAAYIASLKPRMPPTPPAETAATRARGKAIFFSPATGCADCHPPPLYTDSGTRRADGRFVLHDVGTRLPSEPRELEQLDTPSLLALGRSEPYLHDGRARTLEEVFTKFNPRDKHGRTSHLSEADVRALCEFLRYLGGMSDEG